MDLDPVCESGAVKCFFPLFLLRATNQETPKSSPLPSRGGDPVEILVPRDITDPLNLKGGGGDGGGDGGVLLSPLKSRRRHRNRHHGGGGEREVIPARLFPSTAGLTGETSLHLVDTVGNY